jgi:hypothetical protein
VTPPQSKWYFQIWNRCCHLSQSDGSWQMPQYSMTETLFWNSKLHRFITQFGSAWRSVFPYILHYDSISTVHFPKLLWANFLFYSNAECRFDVRVLSSLGLWLKFVFCSRVAICCPRSEVAGSLNIYCNNFSCNSVWKHADYFIGGGLHAVSCIWRTTFHC